MLERDAAGFYRLEQRPTVRVGSASGRLPRACRRPRTHRPGAPQGGRPRDPAQRRRQRHRPRRRRGVSRVPRQDERHRRRHRRDDGQGAARGGQELRRPGRRQPGPELLGGRQPDDDPARGAGAELGRHRPDDPRLPERRRWSLKYASKPVVMAPFGLCLGGGAELVLHGQRVRASAETYIGLVEVGAGVVPAGGGCKELYLRNLEHWTGTENLLPVLQQTFEAIGMAKVATSAVEGRGLRFLRDSDGITMNPHRLIADAKQTVLSMVREGWRPGARRTDIPVMGRGRQGGARGRAVQHGGRPLRQRARPHGRH